jgi:hypothetical protein
LETWLVPLLVPVQLQLLLGTDCGQDLLLLLLVVAVVVVSLTRSG